MIRPLLLVTLVIGCGGSKKKDVEVADRCDDVFAKLAPLEKELAVTADAEQKKECHAKVRSHKPDALVACVSAAKDAGAIKACVADNLSKHAPDKRFEYDEPNDAEIQLRAIVAAAKASWERGVASESTTHNPPAFPDGTSATLPDGDCCKNPDKTCPPGDWAKDPAWSALGVKLDKPTRFHFAYKRTAANTFNVTATGDPDCSGATVDYAMSVDAEGSVVGSTLTVP